MKGKMLKIALLTIAMFVLAQISHIGTLFADQSYWEKTLERIGGGKPRTMEASPEGFSDITTKSVEKIQDLEKTKDEKLKEEAKLPVKGPKASGGAEKSPIEQGGFKIPVGAKEISRISIDSINATFLAWQTSDGLIQCQLLDGGGNAALSRSFTFLRNTGDVSSISLDRVYAEYSRSHGNIYIRRLRVYGTCNSNIRRLHWTQLDVGSGSVGISSNPLHQWKVESRHSSLSLSFNPRYGSRGGGLITTIPDNVTPSLSYENKDEMQFSPRLFKNLLATRSNIAFSSADTQSFERASSASILPEESYEFNFAGFEDIDIPEDYEDLEEYLKEEFDTYGFIDLLATLVPEEKLEDMVKYLNNKEDKTAMEEGVLELSSIILVDSENIDNETKKEFQEAMHLILVAGKMENILEGVNFGILKDTILSFSEVQKELFKSHLDETDEFYSKIAQLLGISITDELLPDKYLQIPNLSVRAKRKIILDRVLENLKKEGKPVPSTPEAEALRIAEEEIIPRNNKYMKALKENVTIFVNAIKKILQAAPQVSLRRGGEEAEAVFILNETIKK